MNCSDISLFLDCGAPGLYNRFIRKVKGSLMGSTIENIKFDDYSYTESNEYKQYRDDYIEFVKKHELNLEVYSNLDIIHNPEKTWENQLYLESAGIHPLPIYHLGCDVKWLKMYIDKGYGYIGLGGITPNPYMVIRPALDIIWRDYLTDNNGMPVVKVHGFAATAFNLMSRYPFYSVDSTSWLLLAAYGKIWIPKFKKGNWIYNDSPWTIAVSSQSPDKKVAGRHISNLSSAEKELFELYFSENGMVLGKSTFRAENRKTYKLQENEQWGKDFAGNSVVELIIEKGVSNSADCRLEANAKFIYNYQQNLPPWPWSFKHKFKPKIR